MAEITPHGVSKGVSKEKNEKLGFRLFFLVIGFRVYEVGLPWCKFGFRTGRSDVRYFFGFLRLGYAPENLGYAPKKLVLASGGSELRNPIFLSGKK